jgi:hypothetical protein
MLHGDTLPLLRVNGTYPVQYAYLSELQPAKLAGEEPNVASFRKDRGLEG